MTKETVPAIDDYSPYSENGVPFAETFERFTSTLMHSRVSGHMKFPPVPNEEFLNRYYNGLFSEGGNETYNIDTQFTPDVIKFAREVRAHMQKFANFPDTFTTHDCGCALGALVYGFQQIGLRATGNEPNRQWVEAGNALCNGALSSKPLEEALKDLPYKIDLFTSLHVIEHLQEPIQTFTTMKQHLSREGLIYVTVPNAASFQHIVLGMRLPQFYSFPMHLQYFSPKSMVSHIRAAGLEPFFVSTRQLPPSLHPEDEVFESLLDCGVDAIVAPDAWRQALGENLLAGELFILAGHPDNTTASRMADLDERVEKAHRLSALRGAGSIFARRRRVEALEAELARLNELPHALLAGQRTGNREIPRSLTRRFYAFIEVAAKAAAENGILGTMSKVTRMMRQGGWRAVKCRIRDLYLR